jgi:hypothetical protein
MWFHSVLTRWASGLRQSRRPRPCSAHRRGPRLALEQLEDRSLPSTYTAASVSDLIADIDAANLNGGPNTIVLASSTTFTLTATDNSSDGSNGLPVVAGPGSLTILGNGDTIQRSMDWVTPAFRLFDVAGGGSLTLQDLTLQNGLAVGSGTAFEGGAVLNQGTLSLSGVTIQGNVAGDFTGGAGGGVYNTGTLTVAGTTISGNFASYAGAGLYNAASATIGQSTVSGNTITNGGGDEGSGGGIWNTGNLSVSQCTVSGNFGGFGLGGGLYNASDLTIDQSTLSDNSTMLDGGGIANDGKLSITASTVSGSSSTFNGSGGGISNSYPGSTSIKDCIVSGNSAANLYGSGTFNYGGGVSNNGGRMRIEQSNLSGNSCTSGGGAVFNVGSLDVDHCTLSGNAVTDSYIGDGGGAIENLFGTLRLDHCTLSGNSDVAYLPGAGGGGAIDNVLGNMSINQCALSGNSAANGYGGAILTDGALTINQSMLSGNSAALAGGGIYNDAGTVILSGVPGTLTVANSTVCDDSAPVGADLYNAGSATLIDTLVCMIANTGQLTVH